MSHRSDMPDDETPTERWFPPSRPEYQDTDLVSRVLACVAILVAVGLYLADYSRDVDAAARARAACAREQNDIRVEMRAWRSVSEYGLNAADARVRQLASIARRDCNKRYPDPNIL